MKACVPVIALAVSLALLGSAEAAAKKRKKEVQRAPASPVYSATRPHPHDVWFAGEYVGRDPDPNIRSFMVRNPRIYDGFE